MQDIEHQVSPSGVPDARLDAGAPRDALADRSAQLHEVDHRVKNNLQLIASLILLQSRRAEDPAARQALKTVLERVNAVATVHRRLFQGDVQRFDVAEFLRDLAGDLAAATTRSDITIALDLERVEIAAASAAPFALVANELLGNALKHAFPAGRAGRVEVTLREANDRCVLTIADDGVGPGDSPPGFGLTIVRLLCQQLHADLDVETPARGNRISVRAPLSRTAAS